MPPLPPVITIITQLKRILTSLRGKDSEGEWAEGVQRNISSQWIIVILRDCQLSKRETQAVPVFFGSG